MERETHGEFGAISRTLCRLVGLRGGRVDPGFGVRNEIGYSKKVAALFDLWSAPDV